MTAAGLALLCFAPAVCRLTVREEGKIVMALPLDDGESFSIRYTHSVNRLPVTDNIERTGMTLTVRSSFFTSFGAGIPVADDFSGETLREVDGGILLENIDTEYESVSLITGTYANHRLIWRGRELTLKEYVGEQTLVTLRVEKIPLITLVFPSCRIPGTI